MAGELEKEYKEHPFWTGFLVDFLGSFQKTHHRYVGPLESLNREIPTLDQIGTTYPGAERKRIFPWLVDAATIALSLGYLKTHNKLEAGISISLVILSLLAFRTLFFPISHALVAATTHLPVYRRALLFLYFPGILIRSVLLFDVVLPQTLFLTLAWGKEVGQVALCAGMFQYVLRIVQGHRVYTFAPYFRPFEWVTCLIGLPLLLRWIWS